MLILGGAVLGGCISVPVKQPPMQLINLGGREVEFRDYRQADVCQTEPRWFTEELRSVNRMLREWAAGAELEEGKVPPFAQRQLIKKGQDVLPEVLVSYGWTLDRLKGCGWGFEGQLKEAPKEGRELVQLVEKRLQEVPGQIARAEFEAQLAEWRLNNPKKRDRAKETWCPPGPTSTAPADIYFAFQDEEGVTRWLFCNGAEVVRTTADATATVQKIPPPPPKPRGRRRRRKVTPPPKPEHYLKAAATYPAKEVDRPPEAPQSGLTARADE